MPQTKTSKPEMTMRVVSAMLWRALTLRCPHCGSGRILSDWFHLKEHCPRCGLHLEREENDYFLGAYMIALMVMEGFFAICFLVVLLVTWPNPPWDWIQWGGAVVLFLGVLAAYPFALFFSALYTESLFLLAAAGAFYHFSKEQFGRAAAWGVLAGLTRVNGAFLVVPLAVLAVSSTRLDRNKAFAAAAAPAAGLALYALFIWRLTGDPLAFLSGHLAWGRSYQGVGALVAQQYSILANAGLSGYVGTPGYDALNAIGALFAVVAIWPVTRRLGVAYGLFVALNILPALADGGLLSAGRLSSILVPAFIWLAAVVPPHHRAGWIAGFAALQAFAAALFYTWRPLF